MSLRLRPLLPLVVMLALARAADAAPAPTDTVLTISGDVGKPYVLTAAEFAAMPHFHVRAVGHDSLAADYAGVPVQLLLEKAGLEFGEALRGAKVATVVVAGAMDGYRAAYSMAELDSSFAGRKILISDRRDGKPNAASDGFLRIVVPGELHYARWVRHVASLNVRKL